MKKNVYLSGIVSAMLFVPLLTSCTDMDASRDAQNYNNVSRSGSVYGKMVTTHQRNESTPHPTATYKAAVQSVNNTTPPATKTAPSAAPIMEPVVAE